LAGFAAMFIVDVREITRRSRIFDSRVRISSCMPVAK
jgi:hypothetical protein